MGVITMPTISAASLTMGIGRGDVAMELFGGADIIMSSTKAAWFMQFPLRTYGLADTRAWRSVLAQLTKLDNYFQIPPPDWSGNGAGFVATNPTVDGGGQLGTTLNVTCSVLSTTIALNGDYFSVNGEFKVLTADATTDGSGDVTLAFEPALRSSPSNGASVEIKTPVINLRLRDPKASWAVRPPALYNITVDCVEAIYG